MKLSDQLSPLPAAAQALEAERDAAVAKSAQAEARATTAEKALADHLATHEQPAPTPTPTPAPAPTPAPGTPDVEVTLGGVSFRPSGTPERWRGKESRWAKQLHPEVRALIDVQDSGQVRVTFERCAAGLSTLAPVLTLDYAIRVGAENRASKIRLHHHTRPTVVFKRTSPPNRAAIDALFASGLVPRYDRSRVITEDELARIDQGRYPYETWGTVPSGKPPLRPAGSYDPISEDSDEIVYSWTGGAGPLLNEAALLMPHQIAFLLSADPRAWKRVVQTADSAGNYVGVHYWHSGENRPMRPEETRGMFPEIADPARKYLQDPQVSGKSLGGAQLPIPEPAHEHSLVYLAAVLTGERYYYEELAAWNTYNLLTRPANDLRYSGILYSGQVRAAAWSYWALLCLIRCTEDAAEKARLEAQLRANMQWMNTNLATPGAKEYRATGVLNVSSFTPTSLLRYVSGTPGFVSTFMHWMLLVVLGEIVRAGYAEAKPIRLHVLKLLEGLWLHRKSPYDLPWGQHVDAPDVKTMVDRTFEKRTTAPTTFGGATGHPPDTVDRGYAGWVYGALLEGEKLGLPWAQEALAFLRPAYKTQWGALPIDWHLT